MRLLNTTTFKVVEFYTDIPLYAILSHTWGKGEVTFQDIQDPGIAKSKAGWSKVANACAHARKYMFEWIWIDSCCIDKSSSAELSEAINSMHQYYKDAEVCYAYLDDVSSEIHPRDTKSNFWSSRWFTRGWTLQELLAPRYLVLFDENWAELGTKWSLRDVISAITSIPVQVFEGRDINEYSVAQKMSWAASRQTTRPEDQAYSLMGIFGINMSPIYGEGGPKAFMRLQQEIIKISDDRSIFAWTSTSEDPLELRGLFARSPEEFRASGVVGPSNTDSIGTKSFFSFANNGLHIHLPITPVDLSTVDPDLYDDFEKAHNPIYQAPLHCQSDQDGSYLYIYLQRTFGQGFVRCHPSKVALISRAPEMGNLNEVVIKEASSSYRAQKKKYNQITLSIRSLSDSLIFMQGVNQRGHPIYEDPMPILTGFDPEDGVDEQFGGFAKLIFQDCYSSKLLHVIFRVKNDMERIALVLQDSISQKNLPMDRAHICLSNGIPVTAALQITGQQKELGPRFKQVQRLVEIEHDFRYCSDAAENLVTRLLQPSNYGFMVPANLEFTLHNVSPSSHFDCSLPNHKHYISMHNNINQFCVLEYTQIPEERFYVLLGLQEEGKAWVKLLPYSQPIQEVWETGHGLESKRLPTSQTAKLFVGATYIYAKIYKSKTLQVNSHVLDFSNYYMGHHLTK